MSKSNILSSIELLSPIICQTETCHNHSKYINFVLFPMNEEESFFQGFGKGEYEADSCSNCNKLGELLDILPYFFYSLYEFDKPYTVAMNMSVPLIQRLIGLLKNIQEDKSFSGEKIYSAADAMCDCFNDFHVFKTGDDGDFVGGDWSFEEPRFNERSKVVKVNKQGICFSTDISIKGDNEVEIGNVSSCWFSLEDLAMLEGWLVGRGVVSDKEK